MVKNKHISQSDTKKKVYEYILALVPLFLCFIFVTYFILTKNINTTKASLFSSDNKVVSSVELNSDDYDEPGSWQVKKSAEWINKDNVKLTISFDSKMKYNDNNKDIILVLDTSESMNGNLLDTAKNDIKTLVDYLFSESNNTNSRISIITFNTDSEIIIPFSSDKEEILNKLNDIQAEGLTNYNAGLENARSVLESENYKKKDKTDLVILFLVDGYPTNDSPKEVATAKIIREKYPYIKINSIQYNYSARSIEELNNISDTVYLAGAYDLKNVLLTSGLNLDIYKTFEINDYIDDTYFDIKSVSTTIGKVNSKDNKITWNLNELPSGSTGKVEVLLKLKDRYKDTNGEFRTNKNTDITYQLGENSKTKKTIDESPVLKNYYNVTYDINTPSGCVLESIPSETHISFDNVSIKEDELYCPGYQFKGWVIVNDNIEIHNSNTFKMPEEDVVIRATWAKQSLKKSMDGKVFRNATLYRVIENEALSGSGYAREYTGNHSDSFNGTGTQKIYYYHGNTYNDGLQFLNKNNVIFAKHCWEMIRTTDTGGVKLLYHGEPDINGSCNYSRKTHPGVKNKNTIYLNNNFYYGSGYAYDENTKKFSLTGDVFASNWSESTAPNLFGKYTCRNTSIDGTCTTIYYVDSYKDYRTAYVYIIDNASSYFSFGNSQYNYLTRSPADVGYMYNGRYEYAQTSITQTRSLYSVMVFSNSYYFADSSDYDPDSGYYTLNNPYRLENANNLSSLVGKYTFRSSNKDSRYRSVYYITEVKDDYIYLIDLWQGESTEDYSGEGYYIGDSYTQNSDGTYTLTNSTYYNLVDWPNTYNSINKGMYYCDNGENTCEKPYYIVSTDSVKILYIPDKYVYGKSFDYTYNPETNKYEYVLTEADRPDDPPDQDYFTTYHYTCLNSSGRCEKVLYIYLSKGSNPTIYYITLDNGKGLNEALDDMLFGDNVNTNDSTIKKALDIWYEIYMKDYSDYLEDTVFCNDRSVYEYNGWKINEPMRRDYPDYYFSPNLVFRNYDDVYELDCPNDTDRFSTKNPKATLTYPIGLITTPELNLANNSFARNIGKDYWTMSPFFFNFSSSNVSVGASTGYEPQYSTAIKNRCTTDCEKAIRPVVSLNPFTEYIDGDGSLNNPYIIESEGE